MKNFSIFVILSFISGCYKTTTWGKNIGYIAFLEPLSQGSVGEKIQESSCNAKINKRFDIPKESLISDGIDDLVEVSFERELRMYPHLTHMTFCFNISGYRYE